MVTLEVKHRSTQDCVDASRSRACGDAHAFVRCGSVSQRGERGVGQDELKQAEGGNMTSARIFPLPPVTDDHHT